MTIEEIRAWVGMRVTVRMNGKDRKREREKERGSRYPRWGKKSQRTILVTIVRVNWDGIVFCVIYLSGGQRIN